MTFKNNKISSYKCLILYQTSIYEAYILYIARIEVNNWLHW